MTVYLFELIGLGFILFLVAMIWERRQTEQGESFDHQNYRVTLDEKDRIVLLEEALRLARSRSSPEAPLTEPRRKASTK